MNIIEHKGYQIKPHKDHPMSYIVVTSGKGGKIPDILSGLFTHPVLAKTIIDTYLEGKPAKDIRNDKASNQSGS